jgi:hypothetical protein
MDKALLLRSALTYCDEAEGLPALKCDKHLNLSTGNEIISLHSRVNTTDLTYSVD